MHKYFTKKLTVIRILYILYFIYIYVYISIYIFKCTFRIINFSALSTLSITLENYKRNAIKFVSFTSINFMPLKCYYICRAEQRAGVAGGRICVGVAFSRIRRSLPLSHTERSFFISLFRSKFHRYLSKASYRRYDRSSENYK